MPIIIPKLELRNITDDALDQYAEDKVTKINLEAAFAAVIPTTVNVDAKKVEYQGALSASIDGTKAQTAAKDAKRIELERMLTLQAQNCAEIANGDLVLYLKSGYDAKDIQGSPTGVLGQATGLELDGGGPTGTLFASWKKLEDAVNFTVQVFSDPVNPDTTVIKTYTKPKIGLKKTKLDGLPTGMIVYVRVRGNGGSEDFGDWSDIAQRRVP